MLGDTCLQPCMWMWGRYVILVTEATHISNKFIPKHIEYDSEDHGRKF